MNEENLLITFSLVDDIMDPYWLNIQLVEEPTDDGMTVGEVANLVDKLYEIVSCGDDADPYNIDEGNPVKEEPTEDKWQEVLGSITSPTCDMTDYFNSGDGGYDAKIKIFRSHPGTEVYRLRLSNGEASQPYRKEERVTHTLEIINQKYVVLDNPIMKSPVAIWLGANGPKLKIKRNTIYWDYEFTGTLKIEFDTEYDLIDIHVHGEPGDNSEIIEGTLPPGYLGDGFFSGSEDTAEITSVQNIQCTVLAFYHYQYEELILNRPELDESVTGEDKDDLCDQLGRNFDGKVTVNTGDDIPQKTYDAYCLEDCLSRCEDGDDNCVSVCYERCTRWCEEIQESIHICNCSKSEEKWEYTKRVVCPSDLLEGEKIRLDPIIEYVNCGETDEVNDPSYYAETCCRDWPWTSGPNAKDMPKCKKVYSKYSGDAVPDVDRSLYPENTAWIGVHTRSGTCGEKCVEQRVEQKNCCEEHPPVYLLPDDNPTVILDNSSAILISTGGTPPFTWTVDGEGVYFLEGDKKVSTTETSARSILLHADDACGTIQIVITDACNESAKYGMRAASGSWVTFEGHTWDYYWGTFDDWKECEPENPPDGYEPGAESDYEVITATESNWTVAQASGGFRLIESGASDKKVIELPGVDNPQWCTTDYCGGGRDYTAESSSWPPCLNIPSIVVVPRECVAGFCSDYDDGLCCFDCGEDYRVYFTRYIAPDCAKGVSLSGGQILSRTWQKWDC